MKYRIILIEFLLAAFAGSVSDGQALFINIRSGTSVPTPSISSIAAPAGIGYCAAAPVIGTIWNNVNHSVTVPQNSTPGSTFVLYNGIPLTNSIGLGVPQTLTVSYYSAVTTGTRNEPSTAGGENTIQPGGVMAEAWRNYLNASGNYLTFTISNLTASSPYGIYLYGGTGTSGQGVGLTLPSGYGLVNSPTNAFTTNTTANSNGAFGALWTVSGGATNLMPQGSTWNTLYGRSDSSGVFKFLFNGLAGYAYFNGFQIAPLSAPGLSGVTNQTIVAGNNTAISAIVAGLPAAALQWRSNNVSIPGATNASLVLNNAQYTQNGTVYSLVASNIIGVLTNSMTLTVIVTPAITGLNNQAAPNGSTVTIPATVSGVPTPILQWQFNGNNLSDGATGNGSTISGSSTSTLIITNAQADDSGAYSLIASNSAGIVTNTMTLTVSSGTVVPGITGPANQTVVQTSNATFTASVSGLPVPTLQWQANGTDIPGATGSSLIISNVTYSQNGFIYSLIASNSAGMATNSAMLFVLVPPSILQQPTNISVVVNSPVTFNVSAGGVPDVSYQWCKNGNPIANATAQFYTISQAQGNDSGNYSVVVSNTVGVVTSSNAVLTVLSTMTGTFLPTNGAVNISPDQQLRIVFSSAPHLGSSGKLYIRSAADNFIFSTIDVSQFQTFSLWSATIPNAAVRTEQGNSFYYMPIAIYGNEAWITLNPTNRFAYNSTYYVNCDAGVFLDASNAAFPAIAGTSTWKFSTKAAGPPTPTTSTGPTNITIGMDGTGDFATLQGASDWIPQNNTLKRTITILPGIYRDFAIFTQNRNNVMIVGEGVNQQAVQIIYPYPAYSGANDDACGLLRLESSSIYVRNLTLDNDVYVTNNGVVFAGPINTLATTGNKLIFDNVLIKGGQDTLYTISGSIYFNHCEIWGDTDFIYGGALSVFDQCNIIEIRSSGGPCTAPSTPYSQPYGLVFLNCTFPDALIANGYPYNVSAATTTFMRPWGQDGSTALVNCSVGSQVTTKGWSEWDGRETTCRAREYGTTLIGGGSITPAQRQAAGAYWLNTIDPDYTNNPSLSPTNSLLFGPGGTNNRVAVTVDPTNYTLAAIFGNPYFNFNGWVPTVMPTITSQPTNQTTVSGTTAAFTVAATGLPTPSFQWLKNGVNYPNGTNATLTIPNVQASDAAVYSAIISNSAGSILSSNALLSVIVPVNTTPTNLVVKVVGTTIHLSWPDNHLGWRLQFQTNWIDRGLSTNWIDWPGSTNVVQTNIVISPAAGSAFFRLIYP